MYFLLATLLIAAFLFVLSHWCAVANRNANNDQRMANDIVGGICYFLGICFSAVWFIGLIAWFVSRF